MAKYPLLAPVAVDDALTTAQGVPVSIDLLSNDYDDNGDKIALNYINNVKVRLYGPDLIYLSNGYIEEINNGKITFHPDPGFIGTVTFTYVINDRNFWVNGLTAVGTVVIDVTGGTNSAPVAVDDNIATVEDFAVIIDAIANDADSDGDALSILTFSAPANGDVTENPDGTLTYTPHSEFAGVDSFDYTVSDGNGGSSTATVTIDVAAVNDLPVAADDAVTAARDTTVVINVLANDTDSDGDMLSISTFSDAANGDVTENPDGTLTYTPHGGFTSRDTFDYTVTDGNGGTSTATVTIDVTATSPHNPTGLMNDEHVALLNLVQHADATHSAINSGSWFDAATWAGGIVPGDDAKVLISSGVVVDYDGISNDRLKTVRVDGELKFSTTVDSKIVVDTLVIDTKGKLTAGTASNPVESTVNIDIVIANNGDINVTWDPLLISRGVISHGRVEIHGQEKTTHLKVETDPMAGDTSLTLSEIPLNWQIGDTIVLTGTQYDGYIWPNSPHKYKPPQDEILTISDINGETVFFDTPLQFNHATPRGDLKASVANYTRNVSIETENGNAAETHHRGHVMFMHNDEIDVRFAEFSELGRTDKSKSALNAHEFSSIASDSNVKGRYSFHLHKTGIGDVADPAVAEGNAVFGSPGWGFVHHDSHAILNSNATYNTFGAGYVAESGNETGAWANNIAIFAKGINWSSAKNQSDGVNFDTARGGDGFFFQGRMIKAVDNVAASVNHGFTYYHRGRYQDLDAKLDGQIRFDPALFDLPEALGSGPIDPNKTPILHFSGNEAFAANEGLHIVKNNPHQGHDIHSKIRDFTAWEVNTGAFFDYTGHYVLDDLDLVAKSAPARVAAIGDGIVFGQNAVDMTAINPKIDSFANGINLKKNFSFNEDVSVTEYKVVNPTFLNIVNEDLLHYDPNIDEILDSNQIQAGNFSVDLQLPLIYDPLDSNVKIFGTKTDGVGTIDIPAGTDGFDHGSEIYGYNVTKSDTINILEQDGYYSSGGTNYFILESYYTDRATGEIFKTGHIVEIGETLNNLLGVASPYENAIYAGTINLSNSAPVAQTDAATTLFETDVLIDLLLNDSDPDGDLLEVNGIVQPNYGSVFDNSDGTITYRPGLNFTGNETFKYWVSDNQGGFTEGIVSVDVLGV